MRKINPVHFLATFTGTFCSHSQAKGSFLTERGSHGRKVEDRLNDSTILCAKYCTPSYEDEVISGCQDTVCE